MATSTSTARGTRRSSSKAAKTTKTAAERTSVVAAPVIDPQHRRALIAKAAYYRAERRNFASGFEAEDWLAAESEVDTTLTMGVLPSDN